MKYQVLFSLKNNENVIMNVVCCSRDWRLRVKEICGLPVCINGTRVNQKAFESLFYKANHVYDYADIISCFFKNC